MRITVCECVPLVGFGCRVTTSQLASGLAAISIRETVLSGRRHSPLVLRVVKVVSEQMFISIIRITSLASKHAGGENGEEGEYVCYITIRMVAKEEKKWKRGEFRQFSRTGSGVWVGIVCESRLAASG